MVADQLILNGEIILVYPLEPSTVTGALTCGKGGRRTSISGAL